MFACSLSDLPTMQDSSIEGSAVCDRSRENIVCIVPGFPEGREVSLQHSYDMVIFTSILDQSIHGPHDGSLRSRGYPAPCPRI